MAITSADIQNQSFKIERRGYDVDEVDVFLERVASEIDDLNDKIAHLRAQASEASAARTEIISQPEVDMVSRDELAEKDAKIAELEARLRERKSDDSAIAQALIVAQRTADEIISKAKGEAEQTRINAEEEGKRILDKANAEKKRVIDHINELSASREQVREQYQDMLKEFIGSATQRLSEIGGEVTAGIELPAELLEMPKSEDSASKASVSTSSTTSASTSSKWEPGSPVATYTTPTVTPVVSAPATPKPSAASKDFSGYGDADDSFSFDDVD